MAVLHLKGKEVDESIFGLISIRFKIDKAEKHFIVDLSMSVCMESQEECQFHHNFYDNRLIPIPICNSDMDFSLKDFSMKNWLKDVGHLSDESLPLSVVALLLSQLKLDRFLQDPPCKFSDSLYTSQISGWSSDCSASLTLPTLPENIVCHIPDYCTGIDCCVNIDMLRTTIHVKFLLDTCTYRLTIGIERFERVIILLDYDWGQTKHIYLGGALRIDYNIDDIKSENKFILNVQLSVCFEQTECIFKTNILKDVYIPKPLCSWNPGSLIEGYNLTDWMNDFNFVFDGDSLKDYMIDVLFRELGIAAYLQDVQCNRADAPFSGSLNGLISDCATQLDVGLIPDFMTCYISDSCKSFNCCVDVDFAKWSFNIYAYIDECTHTLSIGIEKFHLTVSLLEYIWGTEEEFSLFGVIRIRGSIVNLETERQYIVNLKISICMKSATCDEEVDLLTDARLPKSGCSGNDNFSDFSLQSYLESQGHTLQDISEQLPRKLADKLLEKLGVLAFLGENGCKNMPQYADNAISECEKFHFTTAIPDLMTCKIHSYCTAIDCCIDIPLIGRSVNVTVDLNACGYSLLITVGKFKSKTSLLNYNFGEWNTLSVVDVFRIEYNIEDLKSSKEFILSVKISVCFDSTTCVLESTVLEQAVLPQQKCEFVGNFQIPGK
ncbi:uncharacterized protein LOC128556927 [Mercenaria mercenaria]|uniref:uncharacterized protein LOC128556927 n=1 Tax=Mercenaria mercenaria TaxID=6596 RepID=UPI00234EEA29|nr:uncharacterized protein LOC128556927 [Mercenaria mercenaria]